MFDEFQNKPTGPAWIGLKIVVAAVAGMLLSFGLCGAGAAIKGHGDFGVLGTLGLGLFLLSILAMVSGGIITAVEIIIAISRGK